MVISAISTDISFEEFLAQLALIPKTESVLVSTEKPNAPIATINGVVSESDFEFNPSTGTITGYTGSSSIVAIPSQIGGVTVTKIGSMAFANKLNIISLILPNTVTHLEVGAFSSCTSLSNVTFSNSLVSIGQYAFWGNPSLTNITLPNSVTSIMGSAFMGCTSLQSCTLPNNLTSLPDNIFNGCSALSSITFPQSVTQIGSYAFMGCSSLTSVTVPSNITTLGDCVFQNCTALTSTNIQANIDAVPHYTFSGCTSLSSVTLPDSIRDVRSGAFMNCSALSFFDFEGCVTIGMSAFKNCSFEWVVLPNTITTVGSEAFVMDSLDRLVVSKQFNLASNAYGSNTQFLFGGYDEATLTSALQPGRTAGAFCYDGSTATHSITFTNNLVIPQYATLNLNSSVSLCFPEGKGIIVNGTLNVVEIGESVSCISGTNDTTDWSGITVGTGGSITGGNFDISGNIVNNAPALTINGTADLETCFVTSGNTACINNSGAVTISNLIMNDYSLTAPCLTVSGNCTGDINIGGTFTGTATVNTTGSSNVTFDTASFVSQNGATALNILNVGTGSASVVDSNFAMDNMGYAIVSSVGSLTATGNNIVFSEHESHATSPLTSQAVGIVFLEGVNSGSASILDNTITRADYGVCTMGTSGSHSLTVGEAQNGNFFNNTYRTAIYAETSTSGNTVISHNIIDNDCVVTQTDATAPAETCGINLIHNGLGTTQVLNNTINNVGDPIISYRKKSGTTQINYNTAHNSNYALQFDHEDASTDEIIGNEFLFFRHGGVDLDNCASFNFTFSKNRLGKKGGFEPYPISIYLTAFNPTFSDVSDNIFSNGTDDAVQLRGTLQRDTTFMGNVCIDDGYGVNLNEYTLTVTGRLSLIDGSLSVNGGGLVADTYIQSPDTTLTLSSNSDVKNFVVNSLFDVDDWNDIVFGDDVTLNVNTYVTGSHTVLNGPGTNYWAPTTPDTLTCGFVRGIWREGSYCYIEYPVFNPNGSFSQYKRGYVPFSFVDHFFNDNTYSDFAANVTQGTVYNTPSTSGTNLGTFVAHVPVTVLDYENGMYYIEYLYNGFGPLKRAYIDDDYVFTAASYVELSESNIELNLEQVFQMEATCTPADADNTDIIWTSSDTDIATVDSTGKVTAKARGTVTITAELPYANSKDHCTVVVQKKAIIILPGMMGSELFVEEDTYIPSIEYAVVYCFSALAQEENGWQMFADRISGTIQCPGMNFKTDDKIWETTKDITAITQIEALKCDNNGQSIYNIYAGNETYGTDNTYKELYTDLCDEYSDKSYDVVYFPYDWRMSCDDSADVLEQHITTNEYNKVVLVAHSMGGLVASCYLTKGAEQREKVEKLITLGTPFLGSPELLNMYNFGLENLLDNEIDIDLGIDIVEDGAKKFVNKNVQNVMASFPSIYELLPTQKWFSLTNEKALVYVEDVHNITADTGHYVDSYLDTKLQLYRKMDNYNLSLELSAERMHTKLFVRDEHITSLVDSYYIVSDMDSNNIENCTTTALIVDESTGNVVGYEKMGCGDGTVPKWSADIAGKYPNKTYYTNSCTHRDLVEDDNVFKMITNIIDGTPNTLPNTIYQTTPSDNN